jgi:hypothetical protein
MKSLNKAMEKLLKKLSANAEVSGWQFVRAARTYRNPGSRIGGTAAWRFSKNQSLKVRYSDGTYIRYGGNYQTVQVAWQYSWLGWPKKKYR